MNKKAILKEIDANIKKWTSRKVWIQKYTLEEEVSKLQNVVTTLEKENERLKKALNNDNNGKYDVTSTLYELEREFILNVMKSCGGNRKNAADSLGITLKTLYNKLHEYGEFDNLAKELP